MRKIHFQGPRNVRDLGGIQSADGRQIRRGQVVRGDGLARMTDADLRQFSELGIATVIDLRTSDECKRAPSKLPQDSDIKIVNHGFMIKGSFEMFDAVNNQGADAAAAHRMMASNYAAMPMEHSRVVRDVFSTLVSEPHHPCYIHCTSGKDRTGLICALLLLALNVAEEDVIEDYVLSNVEHQPVDVFGDNARKDAVGKIMSAHEDFVRAALNSVRDSCGSVENYFERHIGLDRTMRTTLAELMLE